MDRVGLAVLGLAKLGRLWLAMMAAEQGMARAAVAAETPAGGGGSRAEEGVAAGEGGSVGYLAEAVDDDDGRDEVEEMQESVASSDVSSEWEDSDGEDDEGG